MLVVQISSERCSTHNTLCLCRNCCLKMSSLTHPVLVVQSKSNKSILFYVRHSSCGQEIVFIILRSVTKPRVGNKYVIYTGTISYYVLMRNIKYINMTWGLTRTIKAMDDAKQPIISVHYFLKALTWVRSLYTFNGSLMLGYKKIKQITILC